MLYMLRWICSVSEGWAFSISKGWDFSITLSATLNIRCVENYNSNDGSSKSELGNFVQSLTIKGYKELYFANIRDLYWILWGFDRIINNDLPDVSSCIWS